MKNAIYQVSKEDLEAFGEQIAQKVLDENKGTKPEYLTVTEYSEQFKLRRLTVLRHLREGKLRGRKVGKFWWVEI